MATRVRLTADVDPDVKKRVRIAAIESETSVSEWVERAVVRELERAEVREPSHGRETRPSGGDRPHGSPSLSTGDDLEALLEAAVRDREGLYMPSPGAKPKGMEDPIKLGGGKTMAETIIEERGER